MSHPKTIGENHRRKPSEENHRRERAMTFRRLIVPLTIAVLATAAGGALAQGGLSGKIGSADDPAFSPVNGSAKDCMTQFLPLREEAERRGKLIKAAGDRHAGPDEACKLIKNFVQAEIKLISYVETHATKCGIPSQVADQLKNGHNNTEALQMKVCAVAQQMQQRGPANPTGDFEPVGLTLSDVLGPPARLPAGPLGDFGN
jgi:hypothetical protein